MSSRSIIIAIFTLSMCIATSSEPSAHAEVIASRIVQNKNDEVGACDNFYEFACGNYPELVSIQKGSIRMDPMYESLLVRDLRLEQIIEDIDPSMAPKAFVDIKSSYDNCMKSEIPGPVQTATKYKEELQKKWSDNSKPSRSAQFDYKSLKSDLLRVRAASKKGQEIRKPKISLAGQPIASSYFREGFQNKIVEQYLEYLREVFRLLGVTDSQMSTNTRNIVSFEIELAKIIYPMSESYDSKDQYTKQTFGTLKAMVQKLGWFDVASEEELDYVELSMNVNVLKKLENLILSTPIRTLANWKLSRWIDQNFQKFGQDVFDARTELLKAIYGTAEQTPLWKRCVRKVYCENQFLLRALYHGQYISASDVKRTAEIADNVKQQFEGSIKKANWLADRTKRRVLEKLKDIDNNIDHLETFMLKKNVPSSRVPKLSNGILANNRADVNKLLEPASESDRRVGSCPMSYMPELNSLSVGIASYTDGFFHADHPDALNYGRFGAIIGHEMAHSLDEAKRYYDKDGYFGWWWDSRSNETYVKNTKCLVDQYKQCGLDELKLNVQSFKSRNEDISDNVGVKMAYLAYRKLTKGKKPEQQLPGLAYTPNQLFWIGYANTWCSKNLPQTEKYVIYNDIHSPQSLRANVPLMNMPEFAKDFNCRSRTKMNPAKRCTVW